MVLNIFAIKNVPIKKKDTFMAVTFFYKLNISGKIF